MEFMSALPGRRFTVAFALKRRAGQIERSTNASTNVFDVTYHLVICHHTNIDLIQCLVVMKAGISVAGEATSDDRAEDVGVTCYRNVGAGRVKRCENVPG